MAVDSKLGAAADLEGSLQTAAAAAGWDLKGITIA